jgi:hypothetical protein
LDVVAVLPVQGAVARMVAAVVPVATVGIVAAGLLV